MTQLLLEKLDATMFIIRLISFAFIFILIYTIINTTAFITAISTILIIFLICATVLFLAGSSFARFILYISAIAGISVLLSYCLTIIPKISTSTPNTINEPQLSNKPYSKQKKIIIRVIFVIITINILRIKFLVDFIQQKKVFLSRTTNFPSSLKSTLLNINQNILSSPFWRWTSLFLRVVLFILIISRLKIISSISRPIGPLSTILKK